MSPGRLIPLLAVVAVAAAGAVLIFSDGDDGGSSGEPAQELSTPAGEEQGGAAGNEARRSRGKGSAETLDLSELNTPKVRRCMEKANDPDKPVKERTQAILACAGPKSEQVRKAALQSCLGFADTAPDPAEARKLCRDNLGG